MATVGNGVELCPSQLGPGAGLGVFDERAVRVGDIVTEYVGEVVRDKHEAASLVRQTHLVSAGGYHLDGVKDAAAAEGRGGGSFINDCHNMLGKPLPDGRGVFEYNAEYVTLTGDRYLNRVFVKATRSYAAGETETAG